MWHLFPYFACRLKYFLPPCSWSFRKAEHRGFPLSYLVLLPLSQWEERHLMGNLGYHWGYIKDLSVYTRHCCQSWEHGVQLLLFIAWSCWRGRRRLSRTLYLSTHKKRELMWEEVKGVRPGEGGGSYVTSNGKEKAHQMRCTHLGCRGMKKLVLFSLLVLL